MMSTYQATITNMVSWIVDSFIKESDAIVVFNQDAHMYERDTVLETNQRINKLLNECAIRKIELTDYDYTTYVTNYSANYIWDVIKRALDDTGVNNEIFNRVKYYITTEVDYHEVVAYIKYMYINGGYGKLQK